MSIYDYKVNDSMGREVALADYKGKVLLIVNTASKCGFTPQFEGLEALNKKYKALGLEILGFPCNQFGGQDPGTQDEIVQFCQLNYGVSFDMFEKIAVKGKNKHPLFEYLTNEKKGVLGTKDIKWNFTKFLIDREGNVVARFASKDAPEKIESDILKLL